MNRRDFLKFGAGLAIGAALPALTRAAPEIKSPGAVAMGYISGDILTIGPVTHGAIAPGMRIQGCGIADDTRIIAQIEGSPQKGGIYSISTPQNAVNQTLTFI